MRMYKVYNSKGFVVMTTDSEQEADFFAWLNDGYYTRG